MSIDYFNNKPRNWLMVVAFLILTIPLPVVAVDQELQNALKLTIEMKDAEFIGDKPVKLHFVLENTSSNAYSFLVTASSPNPIGVHLRSQSRRLRHLEQPIGWRSHDRKNKKVTIAAGEKLHYDDVFDMSPFIGHLGENEPLYFSAFYITGNLDREKRGYKSTFIKAARLHVKYKSGGKTEQ